MGDLELSLDEIIKKKLKKTDVKRNRNNIGNIKTPIRRISDSKNRVTKNQSTGNVVNKNVRNSNIKNRGQIPQPGIGDARNKIIQNQRHKMADAREKLRQKAKQTDARIRLLKLREQQLGTIPGARSLPLIQRTIQSRINEPMYEDEVMDYSSSAGYLPRNFSDRSVMENEMYAYPYRGRQDSGLLFRVVENEIPAHRLYEQEKSIYSWSKPILSGIDSVRDIPVVRVNSRVLMGRDDEVQPTTPNWDLDNTPIVITKKVKPQETVGILKRSSTLSMFDSQVGKVIKETSPPAKSKRPTRTLSERFCQDGNVTAQKMNLLKAKLEASQNIASNNNTEAQTQVGHRIVVSNLVPSVTHEDVKELFEDIGELISSKVVRPGTAEVVYKLHKDAVKAVDVYHNRQLDGQPMKCLLVNNRSTLAMGSKSLKGVGKSVVEVDMTAFRKALHKKSTS